MLFCRKCGKPLPEDGSFCPFCGTKSIMLNEEAIPVPAAQQETDISSAGLSANDNTVSDSENPAMNSAKSNTNIRNKEEKPSDTVPSNVSDETTDELQKAPIKEENNDPAITPKKKKGKIVAISLTLIAIAIAIGAFLFIQQKTRTSRTITSASMTDPTTRLDHRKLAGTYVHSDGSSGSIFIEEIPNAAEGEPCLDVILYENGNAYEGTYMESPDKSVVNQFISTGEDTTYFNIYQDAEIPNLLHLDFFVDGKIDGKYETIISTVTYDIETAEAMEYKYACININGVDNSVLSDADNLLTTAKLTCKFQRKINDEDFYYLVDYQNPDGKYKYSILLESIYDLDLNKGEIFTAYGELLGSCNADYKDVPSGLPVLSVSYLDLEDKIGEIAGSNVRNESSGASTKDDQHSATGPASDYILPESDKRYYSEEELMQFTGDELRIARNEILARHGRLFNDQDLQNYFNSKPWYTGSVSPQDFDANMDNILNSFEKGNIDMIKDLEDRYIDTTMALATEDYQIIESWYTGYAGCFSMTGTELILNLYTSPEDRELGTFSLTGAPEGKVYYIGADHSNTLVLQSDDGNYVFYISRDSSEPSGTPGSTHLLLYDGEGKEMGWMTMTEHYFS